MLSGVLYTVLKHHEVLRCPVLRWCLQALHDEMAQVDEDLLEADAKNRLYQLLGERTRQEHMALDQKVCSPVS